MLFTPQLIKRKKINTNETFLKDNSKDDSILIESGIVVVKSIDPVSRLFQYITRQEYSLIGFFYKYENNDNIEVKIVHILSGITPNWLLDCKYMSDLENNKYFEKIVIYSSNTIFDDINIQNISLREIMIYLFGNNILYLPVIKNINEILNKTKSLNDDTSIISLIENSPNIILSSKRVITKTSTANKSNRFKKDRTYLSQLIATFIDMIISDPEFLDLVAGKYYNTVHSYDLLYELLSDNIDNHTEILSFFDELSGDGKIDKIKFETIINKILLINNRNNIIDKNISEYKFKEIPTNLVLIDKTPTPEILSLMNNFHLQLYGITQAINNDRIPYIELNNMIKTFNSVSEYFNLSKNIPMISEPVSGIILVSPEEDPPIKMTLKEGNEILITTRNFDLSIFTKDELVEILEYIDRLSIDNRFDYLKNQITKEIINK